MKKLQKSSEQKVLAGVCGGIAEYFKIDVSIVRLSWIFLSFFFFSGVVLYILAAIIMPKASPKLENEWE